MLIKTDLCQDQNKWPRNTQKQVFLLRVVNQVGRILHGEAWTGVEPGCVLSVPEGADGAAGFLLWQNFHAAVNRSTGRDPLGSTFPFETLGPDRFDKVMKVGIGFDNQIAAAKARFFRAAEVVVAACCDETLITCLRPLSGGDYSSPILGANWNYENWQQRMFEGQMDPSNPFDDTKVKQELQWIFVETKSLRRFLDSITLVDSTVTRKAVDEKRCKQWLTEQMKASPYLKPKPKSSYFKHAIDAFNVSKRGFDRIWGEAVRESTSLWNKAGRTKRSG